MSSTEQITQQLETARAALDQALEDGVLSTPFRDDVARLEVALTAAQYAETTAQAAIAAQEAAKAQADALALASTQQTPLHATEAGAALAELTTEQPIAALVEIDPLLLSAAEGVVVARTALERAQRQHGEKVKAAGRIQTALTRKREELDGIKERALAGTATAEDGTAVFVIERDIADLERSLTAARDKVTAAVPAAERGALAAAEQRLSRTRDELAYNIAEDRTRRAAEALLACHKEMTAAYNKEGSRITGGYSTSGRYKPSREFIKLIDTVRPYWGTV